VAGKQIRCLKSEVGKLGNRLKMTGNRNWTFPREGITESIFIFGCATAVPTRLGENLVQRMIYLCAGGKSEAVGL
jgi:hypothetical protein